MDEKVVRIEKIVFGGRGLSRDLDKIVFVPFTLPGEKVRIRIKRELADYYEADAIEIIEPSPQREPPACRYFGKCGGCQLSHAVYSTQLDLKRSMLQESLTRNRLKFPPIEVIASAPFSYRHRVQLKYNPRAGLLGFFETGSNHVVDIKECLCLTPGLNALVSRLRTTIAGNAVPSLTEIECFENEKGETAAFFNARLPAAVHKELSLYTRVHAAGQSDDFALQVKFRDYTLPMTSAIFLQNNRPMWQSLVQEVENHHAGSGNESAVELFCGAGFFTASLARRFRQVYACEENAAAIDYAKRNAGLTNVQWYCERAEFFPFPADAAVLIVDPPRAGLAKKLTERILQHPFQKISYISCDCSSLARDLKTLSPRFEIKQLTILDLFPQTFHFETVALLQR